MKRQIRKFLETDDNENTATQNLWGSVKGVLLGKLIESYLEKQETIKYTTQLYT